MKARNEEDEVKKKSGREKSSKENIILGK